MAPLSIQIYVVGPVQTNCYFAINDDTKEVLIIDPGASAKQLAEKVKEQGLKPVAILLTHGHFDHASAAEELAKELLDKIGTNAIYSEDGADVNWIGVKLFGIKDNEILIGHVGRFMFQKNHEYLINIFNEFHINQKALMYPQKIISGKLIIYFI